MSRQTNIRVRRGTSSDWDCINPILSSGELGFETDTRKFKIGDGVTEWISLEYVRFDGGDMDTAPDCNEQLLSNNTIQESSPIGTTIGNFNTNEKNCCFSLYQYFEGQYSDNNKFYIEDNVLKSNYIFDYNTQNSYTINIKYQKNGIEVQKEFSVIVESILDNYNLSIGSDVQATSSDGSISLTFENISLNGKVFFQKLETSSSSSSSYSPKFSIYDISSSADFSGSIQISISDPGISSQNNSALIHVNYNEETGDIILEDITTNVTGGLITGVASSLSPFILVIDGQQVVVDPDAQPVCPAGQLTYSLCTSGGNAAINDGQQIILPPPPPPCQGKKSRAATSVSIRNGDVYINSSECGCWERLTDWTTIAEILSAFIGAAAVGKIAISTAKAALVLTFNRIVSVQSSMNRVIVSVNNLRPVLTGYWDDIARINNSIDELTNFISSLTSRIGNLNLDEIARLAQANTRKAQYENLRNNLSAKAQQKYDELVALNNRYLGLQDDLRRLNIEAYEENVSFLSAMSLYVEASFQASASIFRNLNTISVPKTCENPDMVMNDNCECVCQDGYEWCNYECRFKCDTPLTRANSPFECKCECPNPNQEPCVNNNMEFGCYDPCPSGQSRVPDCSCYASLFNNNKVKEISWED